MKTKRVVGSFLHTATLLVDSTCDVRGILECLACCVNTTPYQPRELTYLPTRTLKNAQIAGRMDIIYTVYEVPTICFCRREQKERAYQKLGIPFRAAPPRRPAPSEPIISHPVAPSLRERDPQGDVLNTFSEREWFGPGVHPAGVACANICADAAIAAAAELWCRAVSMTITHGD